MDRLPKVTLETSPLEAIPSKCKDNLDIVADLQELREETPEEDDSPFIMPPTREEVKEQKKETLPVKEVIERKIEKRLKEKYEVTKPTPLQKAKTSRRRGRPRKIEPEPEPEIEAPPTPIVKQPEPTPKPDPIVKADDFDDFVKKMERYEKMKKEAFIRRQKEEEEKARKEKELEEYYYQKFKKQQEEAKQFVEVKTAVNEKPSYGMYDNYF